MILGFLLLIGILALSFKATGLIFGIFGRLLGLIFSIIGYVLIGAIALSLIGLVALVIPIVIIAGVISIMRAIIL